MEVFVLEVGDEYYPEFLDEIQAPPKKLYCIGNKKILSKPKVAVVGARKATSYGIWAAKEIAKTLAENGVTVVSGLAYGIDKMAHLGALEAGGDTIAVMAGGLDRCYPKVHENIFNRIKNEGLVLSEYPDHTEYMPFHFPQRNRIISGISSAVVVVEAGQSSGSLITAEFAADQGRTVFAVPGNINSKMSLGSNKLIRDGAIPVVVFEQILRDLGFTCFRSEKKDEKKKLLGKDEKAVYNIIERKGEMSVNQICLSLSRTPESVNGIITVLEMKGLVENEFGKIFIAN